MKKIKWNFKSVPIPKHMEDKYEYPLLKPGHSTSTLLVCMFLGFAIGFLACHKAYTVQNTDKWEREVKRDFYYEEIDK